MHSYTKAPKPFIEEGIAIISPDGEVIRNISINKQIIYSKYGDLLRDQKSADPLHTNNVELLTAEKSEKFLYLMKVK